MGWPNIVPPNRRANRARRCAAVCIAWILAGLALGTGPQVGTTAATATANESVGGPRFEVDAPTFDLGELRKGEDGLARFTVTNPGDETLRILRVKPG